MQWEGGKECKEVVIPTLLYGCRAWAIYNIAKEGGCVGNEMFEDGVRWFVVQSKK